MKTVKENKMAAKASPQASPAASPAPAPAADQTEIHISLAGKYFPNEKSQFGKGTYWYLPIYQRGQLKGLHKRTLFHYLTILRWQPKFIESLKPNQVKELAPGNLRKKTRQTFVTLKSTLEVPEVLMSAQRWADIQHEKMSALCRLKNMDALKNEKKQKRGPKEERFPYDEDRIQCADNFAEFMGSGKLTQGAMDLISIYQKINHCNQPRDVKMYEEMLKGVILTTGQDIVKYYVQQREKVAAPAAPVPGRHFYLRHLRHLRHLRQRRSTPKSSTVHC